MSSRAIKPPRDNTLLTGWQSTPEQVPSIVREEQPTVARILAMTGVFLILLGLLPLVAPLVGLANPVIGPGVGFLSATLGIFFVLIQALVDRERIFRRLYSGIGLAAIGIGLAVRAWPSRDGVGAWFPVIGLPALVLGLVLLVATARHEAEKGWRTFLVNVLGVLGAVMILVGVGVLLFGRATLLAREGIVPEMTAYLILGLLYVGAFLGQHESEKATYFAALGLGVVGLIAIAGGLTRALLPESTFLIPYGLIVMGAGALYLGVCAGVCIDWPIAVLTRRELASYFYSPIAYLVLVGSLLVGWYMFVQFLILLIESGMTGQLFEPIVAPYIFEIIPVVVQMFIVPAVTMRLLAEEKRTGTLEVLLTAPVNEATVVFSKFFAAWIFYLLTWLPWWLYLVALRYMGGEEFDYRPILSFNVAMLAISAGFMSMGLFFSSLTNNQIIAAVLTFVGMVAHLAAYIIKFRARVSPGSTWYELLTYASYLDLWLGTLEGSFAPRYLLFHISVTVFFLYATIKVLEARKWK